MLFSKIFIVFGILLYIQLIDANNVDFQKHILLTLGEYNDLKAVKEKFSEVVKEYELQLYRMGNVVKMLNVNMEQCIRKFLCKFFT